MTLAKDHFFQGEKIDARIEFTNDEATKRYYFNDDLRFGGTVFHATDEKGGAVINPNKWWLEWYPIVSTGRISAGILDRISTLTLTVNDTARFDLPGVYTLYVESNLTRKTSEPTRESATLVSDPVTITLVRLTDGQETDTIAAALQKIGTNKAADDPLVQEGIAELDCLQTRAARDQLIALLPRNWLVERGLLAAPDPVVEADFILRAVQSGQLTLNENEAGFYGELKSSSFLRGFHPNGMSEQQASKRYADMFNARIAAQQEVLAACVEASSHRGPAHVDALWAAFVGMLNHNNPGDKDPDGGKARATLAEHQLELAPAHIKQLLEDWPWLGNAKFLPLVRREASAPSPDACALIALADLRPNEARPIIIREFQRPEPCFFNRSYFASLLLPKITPMPLPQFDALFRKRLAIAKDDPFPIVPVIGCFGSPALLPDMVRSYRAYGPDIVIDSKTRRIRWDSSIKECFFRYWVRCDPKAGIAGLEEALLAQGDNGEGISMLDNPWTNDALPVAKWALQNPKQSVAGEGIYYLQKYGDESSIDSILAALGRFQGSKEETKISSSLAAELLQSKRWHYTDTQEQRLQSLAAAAPAE